MQILLINFCVGTKESKDKNKGTFSAEGEGSSPPASIHHSQMQQLFFYRQMSIEDEEFWTLCELAGQEDTDINKYIFKQNEPLAEKANASTTANTVHSTKVNDQIQLLFGAVGENYGDQFLVDPDSDNVEILEKMTKKKTRGKKQKTIKNEIEIEIEIVQKVDQTIEQFVGNSNKMWTVIKEQLAVQELIEKQTAFRSAGNKLSNFDGIEAEYVSKKTGLVNAGRVADTAVLGIEIAFFVIGVSAESNPHRFGELDNFLRIKTRRIACKLVHLRPIFDMFKRHFEIFRQRLNAKCRKKAEITNFYIDNIKTFLDEKEWPNDKDEMEKKLLNMNIYLSFLYQMDKMCQPFYANAHLNNLPAVQILFQKIHFFVHSTAHQFDQFKAIAHSQGFEVMKQQICQ
uniref:Uncharacterized protein n=1 Tax=Globodera rostochiensis TaxID=31243 RepID=A0A914H476_GLORO